MSKLRDAYWNPVIPACLMAYFAARSYSAGLTAFRILALSTISIWLALAVYDRISGGRFTAWLYSDHE